MFWGVPSELWCSQILEILCFQTIAFFDSDAFENSVSHMVRSTLLVRFAGESFAEIWVIFQKTWFLISFEVIFWNLRKLLMFARTLKYFCSFFWVLIIFWIEFPSLISSVLVREVLPPMLSCCSARLRTHQCQCRRRVLRTPPLWSLKSRECTNLIGFFRSSTYVLW